MLRLVAVSAALCGLALPATASAAGYDAALVDKSPGTALESGESLGGQFVVLRNTGTETWNDVELSGPVLTQAVAAPLTTPGATARFDFAVKAPEVTASTPLHAELTPSSQAGAWTGAPAAIDYTVLPAAPPTARVVAINAIDASTAEVVIEATDNVAVGRVDIRYASATAASVSPDADGKTYRARFPIERCAGVGFAVTDRAGHTTSGMVPQACPALPIPVAHVRGTLKSRFSAGKAGTLVRSLYVMGGPAGGTIRINCKGKGCAFETRLIGVAGPITNLRPLLKGKRLGKGAVLEVHIQHAAQIGAGTRFDFRARKAPKRSALPT